MYPAVAGTRPSVLGRSTSRRLNTADASVG
jgi:hypothetical protein